MIHELIDPKKKTNRETASKNSKPYQEAKTLPEEIHFEGSDTENKESSSAIFIPPWLRNSLGLNHRNNLSQSTGVADLKSARLVDRSKESSHNEFECVKTNSIEEGCCKKATENFDVLHQDCPEVSIPRDSDNVEATDNGHTRPIPVYWDLGQKESEIEWGCPNSETKPPKKEASKMIATDGLTPGDVEKLKESDKKRIRSLKQKNKLRRRITCDSRAPEQSELEKTEMNLLLEMKARAALDSYMKGDVDSVSSEIKQLETKLLLLSGKSHDLNNTKLTQQDLRMEARTQDDAVDQLDKVFEQVKDVNVRGVVRNSDFVSKTVQDKKREEKTGKSFLQKCNDEGKTKADKDSLLSTDDENDIKRFSEFLSKNKNLDEKRKCLEEVRNYFERKRRTRLTKRRCPEEGKTKPNLDFEKKEENQKEKAKSREVYRKSKFALCDEEIVEKAVDEALQKFIELYHFRVTPTVMGNMKKNILQAIATDSLDNAKLNEITGTALEEKKINVELLNLQGKEPIPAGRGEVNAYIASEVVETSNKEIHFHKEMKKKIVKNDVLGEQVSKPEANGVEEDKLKKLRKEFDNFLHSVYTNIDVTNLKLQSIILEKEEQTASTQNVQFVYNFTKKVLEPEKSHSLKESRELGNVETQTSVEVEPSKRNVKIQTLDQKVNCEQCLQTEGWACVTRETQTEESSVTMREIKELKSYDVNTGLYRMVKSKEAGKFYLYPEKLDDQKVESDLKSNSSSLKEKISGRKRRTVISAEKERHKERVKGNRNKRASAYAAAHAKCTFSKRKKREDTSENSISYLYFRNMDKKGSDSVSSRREGESPDENLSRRLNDEDDLGVAPTKDDHLGCFWFWNGEKIAPGCDLKTHVENLIKEKLKHFTGLPEGSQNELGTSGFTLSKNTTELMMVDKVSEKNLESSNVDALFTFASARGGARQNSMPLECKSSLEENKRSAVIVRKKEENEETEEKPKRNVATQDSQMKFQPLNLSKHKISSGVSVPVGRKNTRRNLVLKSGKVVTLRKAEDLLRAVEELKRMKLELQNIKKENTTDTESLLDCSKTTSCSKNPTEDHLAMMLRLKENREVEETSTSDIKSRIKKLIGLVDREVQTMEAYDAEDANSLDSQTTGPVLDRQQDLMVNILDRVNQKERENLWNDVRSFIKTKLGKDINDINTREVCIEIEQDMPKADQGKMKHSILAKGHYTKNEGDVEVEIDLTLEDLVKILRQKQKKTKRRNVFRSSKSKHVLSSSSGQSDFTKEEMRRYQKYLHRFAALDGDVDSLKTFKKKKGN